MSTAATAPAKPERQFATVDLDNPVTINGVEFKKIRLRKPKAGEMRGVQAPLIFQMDVDAIAKLTPRISDPVLTEQDVYDLEPEDLVTLGGELIGFLLSKSAKAAAGLPA